MSKEKGVRFRVQTECTPKDVNLKESLNKDSRTITRRQTTASIPRRNDTDSDRTYNSSVPDDKKIRCESWVDARIDEMIDLDNYLIPPSEIELTGPTIGFGTFTTASIAQMGNLRCATRELKESLYHGREDVFLTYLKRACHLMDKLHHPNLSQFLGIVYSSSIGQFPILVFEYLEINLSDCIEKYGILPDTLAYPILRGVALGLNYLHDQTPPIRHDHLTSNKVLLDSHMTPKITDVGLLQVLHHVLGTSANVRHSRYNKVEMAYIAPESASLKVDEFCFGILIMHVLSGKCPIPRSHFSTSTSDSSYANIMTPSTEEERRMRYLRAIKTNHPLIPLICDCIRDDPESRPDISDIVDTLDSAMRDEEVFMGNRIDLKVEMNLLPDKIDKLYQELTTASETLVALGQEMSEVIHTHNETYRKCSEDEIYSRKMKGLEEEREEETSNREDAEVDSENALEQLQSMERELEEMSEALATAHKLKGENSVLSAEIQAKKKELRQLSEMHDCKKAFRQVNSETNSRMKEIVSEQLRKEIPTHNQLMQLEILWEECASLPAAFTRGSATITKGKVYFGGAVGASNNKDSLFTIYCYDPLKNQWSIATQLPVKCFALSQFKGHLVALGGIIKDTLQQPSNKVYQVDNCDNKTVAASWPYDPMHQPRYFTTALSLDRCLVVVGGLSHTNEPLRDVEVFSAETLKWSVTKMMNLPLGCCELSSASVDGKHYLLGGKSNNNKLLDSVLCITESDIISTLHFAEQGLEGSSPWEECDQTPFHSPLAAAVGGHLIAISGTETSRETDGTKYDNGKLFVYLKSQKRWAEIQSDLPVPRLWAATVMISTTEFYIIGGEGSTEEDLRSVFKGSLNLH